MENTSFPFKATAISEASFKRNRMVSGPIKKNVVVPLTTLFFWKFYFSSRTYYKKLIWCTNDPNANVPTFRKCWSFFWRCFYPVSILNEKSDSLKDVNLITFSTFMLRKRGSDDEVLDWLSITRKAWFRLLWTFFSLVLWVLAQDMFA